MPYDALDDPQSQAAVLHHIYQQYQCDGDGIILTPGLFLGQPIWVSFFWSEVVAWGSEHPSDELQDGDLPDSERWFVGLNKEDWAEWPGLAGYVGIWLERTGSGADERITGELTKDWPRTWPNAAEEV